MVVVALVLLLLLSLLILMPLLPPLRLLSLMNSVYSGPYRYQYAVSSEAGSLARLVLYVNGAIFCADDGEGAKSPF